jgi:hypothetical protein
LSHEKIDKIKDVHLEELYNFDVHNIFILHHLLPQKYLPSLAFDLLKNEKYL